jgi:20S proteasome subunit beta 5
MGIMMAGTDKTGQRLFYLDNDGTRIEGDVFAVGSGGTYALGVIDTHRKEGDLSVKEAVALGKRAIYHATHRDAGSGGVVRVYHVHNINEEGKGWTNFVYGEDVNKLHWKF